MGYEGHSTLDFVVSSLYDDYELKVRIIHFNWCPYTEGSRYEVLDAVNLVQDWHYQNGPLVVVDRYGGTAAATFCALTTLQKQLKREGCVDVYQVCKMCHKNRPGIWRQREDYLNIYKVLEFLTQAEDEIKEILLNGHRLGVSTGNGIPTRRHPSTDEGSVIQLTMNRRYSVSGEENLRSSVHTQGKRWLVEEHARDLTAVGPGAEVLQTRYLYAALIISILGVMFGQLLFI